MYSDNNPFSFLSGSVENCQIARVIAQIDQIKNAGASDSRILKYVISEKQWYSFDLEWQVTKMVTFPESPNIKYQVYATGPDGIVVVSTKEGVHEEEIDNSDDGPKKRGPIRDLARIEDRLYATGMGRQVYRREGDYNWSRQDEGVVQERGVIEVSGFNTIDGLSENNIYAAGFGGEIWNRKNGDWKKLNSPTDVILHKLKVVRDDLIYICGQKGIILCGHDNQWEIIEQNVTADDFWGMEWYNDKLYLACNKNLFTLNSKNAIEKVDMGIENVSCQHLHANDGLLWSFGSKHVCYTEDGIKWNDVTP